MKYRTDFVTNSSSSSYLVVYEIKPSDELNAVVKEELGNFGVNALKEYLRSGKELKEYLEKSWYLDEDLAELIDEGKTYLPVTRYNYSNEGDTEGDDAFLADHIPKEFLINTDIGCGE